MLTLKSILQTLLDIIFGNDKQLQPIPVKSK